MRSSGQKTHAGLIASSPQDYAIVGSSGPGGTATGCAMTDVPAISDRNLEASTHISLKREPVCFAFLSPKSISSPIPIDSLNLDLASADYFQGRASVWTTLEIRSSVSGDRPA